VREWDRPSRCPSRQASLLLRSRFITVDPDADHRTQLLSDCCCLPTAHSIAQHLAWVKSRDQKIGEMDPLFRDQPVTIVPHVGGSGEPLLGVLAERLGRDAPWEAFRARQTYAYTGRVRCSDSAPTVP
jgi:hypothetical protein